MKHLWVGLFLAGLAGCGREGSNDLLPLAVGKQWKYMSKVGLSTSVETLTVTRQVPVEGRLGFECSGLGAASELVWKKGELLAGRLGNTTYRPALPIYSRSTKDWKGIVDTGFARGAAKASLSVSDTKIKQGIDEVPAVTCRLTLSDEGKSTLVGQKTLMYHFVKGTGLVLYEEHSGLALVKSVRLMDN